MRNTKARVAVCIIAAACIAAAVLICVFLTRQATPVLKAAEVIQSVNSGEAEHDTVFGVGSFNSHVHAGTAFTQSDGGALTAGNYYLTSDTVITQHLVIDNGDTVNFCLNGYVLSVAELPNPGDYNGGDTTNVFRIENGTLNIFDDNWSLSDTDRIHPYTVVEKTVDRIEIKDLFDFSDTSDPTGSMLGGVITGGMSCDPSGSGDPTGSCILVHGATGVLRFYGGALSGNAALSYGGFDKMGVVVGVRRGGEFHMSGGLITGNGITGAYHSIYAPEASVFITGGVIAEADKHAVVATTLSVSGTPVISRYERNSDGEKIIIDGALTDGASITVFSGLMGALTSGYSTYHAGVPADRYFHLAADIDGELIVREDGELGIRYANSWRTEGAAQSWGYGDAPTSIVSGYFSAQYGNSDLVGFNHTVYYDEEHTQEVLPTFAHNDQTASMAKLVEMLDFGTYYLVSELPATDDYMKITSTYSFTVSPAKLNVNTSVGYDLFDDNVFTRYYDGTVAYPFAEAMSIKTKNNLPYEVTCGTTEGVYDMNGFPDFIEGGTYKIYYKITAEFHEVYTSYVTVQINQTTNQVISFRSRTGWTYGETPSDEVRPQANYFAETMIIKYYTDYEMLNEYTLPIDAFTPVGTYYTKAIVPENSSVTEASATAAGSFTVAKLTNNAFLSTPTAANVTYGSELNVSKGAVKCGPIVVMYKAKDADDGTYSADEPTAVGSYTVKFGVDSTDNYNGVAYIYIDFRIMKKALTEGMVGSVSGTFTYTGDAVEPVIGISDGALLTAYDYEITYLNNVAAGTAEAVVTAAADGNYTGTIRRQFSIGKASFDMDGITFDGQTVIYDGENHSLAIGGELPAGVTVSYLNNGKTDNGSYTVTAKFKTPDAVNYEAIDDMTATLTIKKVTFDMSGITFDGQTVTYDGANHSLAIGGALPDGVTVTYGNNGKTNAGEYTVTAEFTTPDKENYEQISGMTATLTIKKVTFDMSGITFDGQTVTYNGESHSLAIGGTLPAGVTVTYGNNGKINAGEHAVTAEFKTPDTENYEQISGMTATLTIKKAAFDMSGITFDGQTVTYNGENHSLAIGGALPDGVTVTYGNNDKTNAGEYTVTAEFRTPDTENYEQISGMTATLTIKKAAFDMSGITFDGQTVTYDGESHSLAIGGTLPAGVTVSYENNGKTAAGTYEVVAKFTVSDSANYEAVADMKATLTISAPAVEPEKGGCGSLVADGLTFAGIALGVLAFAVVFAVRKLRGKKQ